ncbi:MAG: helix-turn-helix domain-containing protein [Patescibacteria group bacterium]
MEGFASIFENKRKHLGSSNKGLFSFTQIPNRLIQRTDLTPTEKMVVIVIKMRMMKKDHSWASLKSIAKDVGCSVTTVKKSIRKLEAQGIIVKERWENTRSNVYTLRI